MLRPPSAARILTVVVVSLGLVSAGTVTFPSAVAQTVPSTPASSSPAASTARAPQVGLPTDDLPRPLLGDYDGDGRTDQLWYGPGISPDHVWYGTSTRSFSGRPVTVSETYAPMVGDFDGDGRADVFWYAPGHAADYLWHGSTSRGFRAETLSVDGVYSPFVGDFNGDHHEDIFWYSADGADRVWYGAAHGFTGRSTSVARPYEPVVGDFDGNGTSDVLWYGSGTDRDFLWRGTQSGSFRGTQVRADGVYTPVVGDFGGDGRDDVYWEGVDNDVLWVGERGGGFVGSTARGGGASAPIAGDFDGDGADDLLWNDPGTSGDRVRFGGATGFTSRAIAVAGTFEAKVGDFDGDGAADIFWHAPGDPRDSLWFGARNRGFGHRPSSLDLLPGPSVPLQRGTFATQFDPYGYIAHAMGPTPADAENRQFGYTNSLEAFEANYARGFRVFECDWVRLADGTVLSAHNGTEARYGLPAGVSFRDATRGQLSGSYTVGARPATGGSPAVPADHFTPIFAEDLVALLRAYPDIYVVLDTKFEHTAIVRRFVQLTADQPRLMDQLMPHIARQRDLDSYRAMYPIRNFVLALYRTQAFNQFDDAEVVDFVLRNRVPAVMMWWRHRDPSLSLAGNMEQQRRYTPEFVRALHAVGAVSYVHSLADNATVQAFADQHVGVYSDGPFPPFSTEIHPIDPPTEGAPQA